MESSKEGGPVTDVLARVREGRAGAREELFSCVYRELRRIAAAQMRNQPPGHTLQPTALVHEAYVKLAGGDGAWEDRGHFLAAAAGAMRSILVDHARARKAHKRGGGAPAVTLTSSLGMLDPFAEILAVHDALDRLATLDARRAQVVELRYFAGLTFEEVARVLGVAVGTVHGAWEHARLWLAREMGV